MAFGSLCTRVVVFVLQLVAPKKKRLAEAEASLADQMAKLDQKRSELKGVMEKLQNLNDDYAAKVNKKTELERNIAMCSQKLLRAEKLISGLGGERMRWTQVAKELGETFNNIVGDVLLSGGLVAYLGPFTVEFRQVRFRGFLSDKSNGPTGSSRTNSCHFRDNSDHPEPTRVISETTRTVLCHLTTPCQLG